MVRTVKNKKSQVYGVELIIDLHGCNISAFNRKTLRGYFKEICEAIDMKRCELYFWDDYKVPAKEKQNLPHTKGTSAVQFILTSNITIHTLDLLKAAYINIFSCKQFDRKVAIRITKEWFGARKCKTHFIERI
ncbi:MAG: S-adenosylmethionine decarboxylase [Syntrophales bacterium]|jgi:S-adenosylmethionine/arginine decarboxylase-like enzyme